MNYYSKRKIFEKYKIYLLPFIVVLVILYLWFNFAQPKISDIIDANKELQKGRQKLTVLTKKAQELEELNTPELKEKFNVLDSAVPSEKDIAGFLLGIQRMANEASVSVGLIDVAPGNVSTSSAKNKKIDETTLPVRAKVAIKGSFNNIRDFISKSAKARRLLFIEGISLSGQTAQKADQPINIALNLEIYYQPLPTSLGAISAPLTSFTTEENDIYQKIKDYTYYSYFQSGEQPQQVQQNNGMIPVGKADLFNP